MFFTPAFYIKISRSLGVGRFLMMLKISVFGLLCLQKTVAPQKPCDCLGTVLMRDNGTGNRSAPMPLYMLNQCRIQEKLGG